MAIKSCTTFYKPTKKEEATIKDMLAGEEVKAPDAPKKKPMFAAYAGIAAAILVVAIGAAMCFGVKKTESFTFVNESGVSIDYVGEAKDGVPDGKGKGVFEDMGTYEGDWRNGQPDGTGIFVFEEGDRYECEWKDGLPNGKGVIVKYNGDRYEGELKNGLRDGEGIATYANGDKYVGQFKFGMPEGEGTYYYANGDKYAGEWVSGKGVNGTYYNADGSVKYTGPLNYVEYDDE